MFYKFFCMTHPNRGGHTQKTEKPDFRIRMNRDGSEKKITYIKPYKSFIWCFINFFVRPLLLGPRGSLSKSRYLEVQLVKEPIEGVVVQKNL